MDDGDKSGGRETPMPDARTICPGRLPGAPSAIAGAQIFPGFVSLARLQPLARRGTLIRPSIAALL
jgi:hypothetical protein